MSLSLSEQNPDWIIYQFDNLYKMTENPYKQAKSEIDNQLKNIYGISDETISPWFYQDPFFKVHQIFMSVIEKNILRMKVF